MNATMLMLAGTLLLLSACSSENIDEPPQQATSAHVPTQTTLSDRATHYCADVGGTAALSRQLDGALVGMCQLSNGRRCGETALSNGSCAR